MKKTLLSIAAVLMASATSFGQGYIQATDNSGFTYDCEEEIVTGITWGKYFPECGFTYENGGGGWDSSPVGELKFSWGQTEAGRIYDILTFTTPLDLSLAANQKIRVDLKSEFEGVARPLTYELRIEKGFDENSIALINPINLDVTGEYQSFELDLAPHIASGQDLSHIDKFIFYYERCPVTGTVTNGDLFMKNFSAGSLLITGLNNSTSVANANLYPNPSTDKATITGELKSVSDVRITLVDMLGQEVKVIAQERTSTINATFDVSTVKKGIYSVVTNIDGVPAKSQMLVVK